MERDSGLSGSTSTFGDSQASMHGPHGIAKSHDLDEHDVMRCCTCLCGMRRDPGVFP